jgi:aromatic ring-opening dioxygenase catalytic subunit (LigB family)
MSIAFACAVSHAPGIVAWRDAAPVEQRDRLYAGLESLRASLAASRPDELVLFTSEHWTNFFLDHLSPFCIGRADKYTGPVEPWLKIAKAEIPGDPELATEMLEHCYAHDLEPGFAFEMEFDHGTIIPLHFLTPGFQLPIVPVMFNTLAEPQPSVRRAFALGRALGEVIRRSPRRIAVIATGGMSHDPGERNHGAIDEALDREFLAAMAGGDVDRLTRWTTQEFAAAGAGTIELLAWVALAGVLGRFRGEVIAYEPVKPWATGMGLMRLEEHGS